MENRPDLLIVPGGGWNHKAEHGARKQAELGTLTKMISEMHNAGTIVAGVCTGGMLLAASGILNGRKATMHYLAQDEMSEYGQSFFITELRIKGMLSLQEESLQELIWGFGSRKDLQALKLRLPLNTEWNMRGEVLFEVICFLSYFKWEGAAHKSPTHMY